jgi:2'-5' RNA ligase
MLQRTEHRCGLTAAATEPDDDDNTSGGMIALIPTPEDAARLAIPGGEPPEELHLTLQYLGPDGSVFSSDDRTALVEELRMLAQDLPPLVSKIFGIAHWNGDGDTPSWVWNVGDAPDGVALEAPHEMAQEAVWATALDVPDQHCPWVAHICAEYTDDLSLAPELEQRLGTVTFDRIRVSFGDEDHDIPLTGDPVTAAAGPLRRDPTPLEVASRADFAGVHHQWEAATSRAMSALHMVTAAWRLDLRTQITQRLAADDPGSLPDLKLDTRTAASTLLRFMDEFAVTAGRACQREAEAQGVAVPDWHIPSGEDAVTAALGGRRLLSTIADFSSDLIAGSMLQAAKRMLSGFLRSGSSPEAVAGAIDRELADDRPGMQGVVGSAMTAAQNAGRLAVFEAAPAAETYAASEINDRNTCGPCKQIDGTQFPTLGDAIDAYPVMGYKDCTGAAHGNSCRGFLIALWQDVSDPSVTAGASEGGTAMTTTADTGHYHPHDDVTHEDLAWDGSASRFTDPQYQKACAACDTGDGSAKQRCFLPHHEPGGGLNADGVHAAAQRISSLSGHSPEAVAKAKAHLRGHYKTLGEKPPDSIAATALERATFGVEEGYDDTVFAKQPDCPPGWTPDPTGDGCVPPGEKSSADSEALAKGKPSKGTAADKRLKENQQKTAIDCPPGWEPDPDSDGCVPSKKSAGRAEALAHGAAADADEVGGKPLDSMDDGKTAPWRGPLTVEGIETGDGREFKNDALTWADLPLPLRWNKEDSHGGEPHTVAVNVGRIDKIWRGDNGLVMGEGVLDLSDDDGQRVHDKIKGGFLRGVSVDVDSIKDADMELVWPSDPEEDGEGPNPFDMLFASPEKVVFNKGRIRAATLVDIPAFAEAYIALLGEDGAVIAGGEPIGSVRETRVPRARVASVEAPVRPPATWFTDPNLSVPTGITVTADGRVYGHAALWGTCHIGQAGVCVTPPMEDAHPYFMTGNVWCEDQSSVQVGQITVGTGHAPLSYGYRAASEHYDNTGAAVADVAVGNDEHGIWVAGSIRPGSDESRIRELRAAGQVSGDWRRIGGSLRLVGLLAVNVPGFPVPALKTHLTSGQQLALVAAGIPQLHEGLSEAELDQWAYRRVLKTLSTRVHGEE